MSDAQENVEIRWHPAFGAIGSVVFIIIFSAWLRSEFSYEAVALWLGSLASFVTFTINWFLRVRAKHAPQAETRQQKSNRATMLDQVELFWIKSVLDKVEKPSPTDLRPLAKLAPDKVLHRYYEDDEISLNSTADVVDVFRTLEGRLLITGAPGSGKTIAMLQLVKVLIKNAREDEKQPIPVVLNLASWAEKEEPIAAWLEDQLIRNYQVPKKQAQDWIKYEKLLVCFDGLDEIAFGLPLKEATPYRERCVDAINTFLKNHKSVKLCICSRVEELDNLKKKLDLKAGMILQPLTEAQIADYLSGDDLKGLRALMNDSDHNSALRELSEEPFSLNAMAIAYHGVNDPRTLRLPHGKDGKEARRQDVLDKYTEKQLAVGKPQDPDYKPPSHADTRRYLAWLAYHLTASIDEDLKKEVGINQRSRSQGRFPHEAVSRKSKIIFYIEHLQDNWFDARKYSIYSLYMTILYMILGIIYISVTINQVSKISNDNNILSYLILITFILFPVYTFGELQRTPDIRPITIKINFNLFRKLFIIIKYFIWHISFSKRYIVISTILVLFFAVLGGVVQSVEVFISGAFAGFTMIILLQISAIIIAAILTLLNETSIELNSQPNQAIYNSFQYWILSFAVTLFIAWVARFPANFALVYSFIISLNFGGVTVIRHYILRAMLVQSGHTPPIREYPDFLIYCAEIGLLRQIGGGFSFRHRYLLDYFAREYKETPLGEEI